MFTVINRFIRPALVAAALLLVAGAGFSQDKGDEPVGAPPYTRDEALKTIMNPHEQIGDEGYILWDRCLICHREVPDTDKNKRIDDVKLRFEGDLKWMCLSCHNVIKHPAAVGVSAALGGSKAPNHLVEPPKEKHLNLRLIQKDVPAYVPLEPETGRIFCATCHNPHERGVIYGRGDWGADYVNRLRTYGLDICQYCHRK